MNYEPLKVIIGREERYVIINSDTKEVVDDANSYGYKTKQSCYKALSYKFGGGKEREENGKEEAIKFFKENPNIKEFIINSYKNKDVFYNYNVVKELIKGVEQEFGIKIPQFYLNYTNGI